MGKHTTEGFIDRAKEVHGDKYDYKDVVYGGAQSKVVLHCDVHGRFEIEANSHLKGNGCKVCSYPHRYEPYEVKAKRVHGDSYDYSDTVYVSNKEKVSVRCLEHGPFLIAPSSHIKGLGCRDCLKTVEGKRQYRRLTGLDSRFVPVETHLAQCSAKHNNKYDYSKVKFVNVMTPVEIVCPEHDSFFQPIYCHKVGRGCPLCAKSGFNKAKEGVLYVLLISNGIESFVGYGISNVLKRRMREHRATSKSMGFEIIPLFTFKMSGIHTYELEKLIKDTVPLYRTTMQGFKTESTPTSHLDQLLHLVATFQEEKAIQEAL